MKKCIDWCELNLMHYCVFIEAYFWEEKFSDFSGNSLLDET